MGGCYEVVKRQKSFFVLIDFYRFYESIGLAFVHFFW